MGWSLLEPFCQRRFVTTGDWQKPPHLDHKSFGGFISQRRLSSTKFRNAKNHQNENNHSNASLVWVNFGSSLWPPWTRDSFSSKMFLQSHYSAKRRSTIFVIFSIKNFSELITKFGKGRKYMISFWNAKMHPSKSFVQRQNEDSFPLCSWKLEKSRSFIFISNDKDKRLDIFGNPEWGTGVINGLPFLGKVEDHYFQLFKS